MHTTVVIPCYLVEKQIGDVIQQIPEFVQSIIAINDCSPDNTGAVLERIAKTEKRLTIIHHQANQGVGGATKSGYREALHNGTEIIVKLDGDGQMDPRDIEQLIAPIISGQADFVKGNRFHNWEYAADMPILRKIGNLGLSFLIKLASGYWNIFDPTNGFTAIKASTVSILNLNQLEQGYIFETSQLTELYFLNAQIVQLPMIARYGDGPSSLSIRQSLLEFPPYLFKAMVKRFIRRYIFQDFTAVSVLTIFGSLFLVFGFLFGTYHWIISIALGVPATAGTVMVSAFPMILGIQFLLQALVLDIANTPK